MPLGFKSLLILGLVITSQQVLSEKAVKEKKNNKDSAINSITVIGSTGNQSALIAGIDTNKLPVNAHLVNEEEILRIRFVDPDELLDRIPGETQVRNLRIPDGGKGYTIPMLDGIPLESPYEGATQRLNRVNTADIQRVEVIKGPASALYANNAFGGVVNVVSRDPSETNETEVYTELGNFNRARNGINTSGTQNDLGYFFDINTQNIDGLRDEAKNDRNSFSGKLVYQAGDETKIIGRIERFEQNMVVRGDLTAAQIAQNPTQAGGLSSAEDLEQDALSIKIEHQIEEGQFTFVLVNRIKDTVGSSRFRGPQDENDKGFSMKGYYSHDFIYSNLTLGLAQYRGRQDTKQYDRNDIDLVGPFTQFNSELDIKAYFSQYQINPNEELTLTAGLRYEDIQLSSTLYPNQAASFDDASLKLGFTYQLTPQHQLWFGASEGFYVPQTDDLYDLDNDNPNLKPEQATNIELGFRGSIESWFYDTSIYHNQINDYLVTQEFVDNVGNDFELTTNAGAVTLQGIESVIEYAPKGTNWRAAVTHTYAKNIYDSFIQSTSGAADDLSSKELRRSPRNHINARLAWEPLEGLTAELEGDLYSTYFADNNNSVESRFKRNERINLRISYEHQNWRLWLNGLNLTDTLEDRATFSRGTMRFRTVDGKTYYVGASYKF